MTEAFKDPTRLSKFDDEDQLVVRDYHLLMVTTMIRIAVWRTETKEMSDVWFEGLNETLQQDNFDVLSNHLWY